MRRVAPASPQSVKQHASCHLKTHSQQAQWSVQNGGNDAPPGRSRISGVPTTRLSTTSEADMLPCADESAGRRGGEVKSGAGRARVSALLDAGARAGRTAYAGSECSTGGSFRVRLDTARAQASTVLPGFECTHAVGLCIVCMASLTRPNEVSGQNSLGRE